MSKYQTGLTTRNNILAACRELFYEKGFDATTFVDICNAAQVNQGSIHYHFKNKENILRILYEESIRKNNVTAETVSTDDTLMYTKFFFGGELYLYKMQRDEKFRRFNIDAARLMNTENYEEFVISQANILYFSDGKMAEPTALEYFETLATLAFDNALRLYTQKNSFNLGYHELSEIVIEIYRRILLIDDAALSTIKGQLAEMERCFEWDKLDTTLDPERIFSE